jgi:hypothetical protein
MYNRKNHVTQKEQVRDRLNNANGWVSNRVLSRITHRFSARIYDLRKEGEPISRKRAKNNQYLYYYRLDRD